MQFCGVPQQVRSPAWLKTFFTKDFIANFQISNLWFSELKKNKNKSTNFGANSADNFLKIDINTSILNSSNGIKNQERMGKDYVLLQE